VPAAGRETWTGVSDSQLLTLLREGVGRQDWELRNAVITEFYDRYAPNLATTWLRRTRNPEEAQEVLQETFVRATSKAHTIPESHSVLIWLRTTARNYWLDRKRHEQVERRQMEQEHAETLSGTPKEPAFAQQVISEVDRGKTRGVFERYVRDMEPRDREIMALRLRGIQLKQICAETGISEAECRRSYARIRFLMQKMRLRGFSLTISDLLAAAGEEKHGVD
jgi:RNA polymerase sigma-70 factor (ECF subfamily)